GAPAPLRIDGPERDVRKHHDRRRGATCLEIAFEPGKLLVAQIAEAACLEVDDIDEADEMNAGGIKTVPPGTLGATAVALAIKLLLIVNHVVLAGNVVHI